MVLLLVFPFVIFIFFRNDPADVGLLPDGQPIDKEKQKVYFPVNREFTLEEARLTLPFWVITGLLAMQGLYITGFTFHVVSVFSEVDLDRATAVSVFQPTAVFAVIFTILFSWIADRLKIKYLAYAMSIGGCLSCLGMVSLSTSYGFYLLVVGNALAMSLYGLLNSIAMPRFFGKSHLGAIVGQTMMIIVFGSAIGPYLMSTSLSYLGSYFMAGMICFTCFFVLGIGAFWMKNPQLRDDVV
jgi:MFS family permease